MLVMAETFLIVLWTLTALANDFTWPAPPAQVHAVDQTRVVPETEVYVVHCVE